MTDTKLRNLSDFLLGIFFASAQDAELDAAIGPIGATSQSGAEDRPSSDDGSVASPDDPVLASQSAAAPNLTVSATGTPLQLAAYSYTPASEAGSNVPTAWRYSTGQNTTVAVIDDGFDPTITGLFANFNSALSVNFGQGGPGTLPSPSQLIPRHVDRGGDRQFGNGRPADRRRAERHDHRREGRLHQCTDRPDGSRLELCGFRCGSG